MSPLTVLGLETSCDETAAAILRGRPGTVPEILCEITLSQIEDHRPFGGVVPEIAARAHLGSLELLIQAAISRSGVGLGELDGIAATAGPGLIGGVLVGLTMAKAIALAADKPLLGVNHLEGHALSVRLVEAVPFPYLLLLVSGGHCQILVVEGTGKYRQLGTTVDDAAGEAFDKAARLLGLAYPGGPAIEKEAASGNPDRFEFPRPMLGRPGCDFSFSGLKTALRQKVDAYPLRDAQSTADLAAGFQAALVDCLADRLKHALGMEPGIACLVAAGGVAANHAIRARLDDMAHKAGLRLVIPPIRWCTDNAAMIALAGLERLACGLVDQLDMPARPRWPLDPAAARLSRRRGGQNLPTPMPAPGT